MPLGIRRPGARRKGSARREPFEALDPSQVDAVEDHLQLAGGQLEAGLLADGRGEVVAPLLQALAPQAQAMPAPVQDLEAVGLAVAENEQVARQRVGLLAGADQGEQAVKTQTHINGLGAEPELDGRWQAQHDAPPRAWTTERTQARSQPGARRRRAPPGRTSSSGTGGGCTETGNSRGPCSWPGLGVAAGSRASAAKRRFQA